MSVLKSPWFILMVLCTALGLHNGSRIGPSSLVDELRLRYGIDYGGVGNVIGAYTLTYAFAQLSAGLLTDRFGSRRLLLIGLGLMAAGSFAFAVAEDYLVGLVGRAVMGIAGGFLYTPSIAYLVASFHRDQRGRVLSLAQSGTGAGLVLSIALLPLLFGFVGLAGSLLVYTIMAAVLWVAVFAILDPVDLNQKSSKGGFAALARPRDFWLLLIGYASMGMFAQSVVFSWFPTYLRAEHSWTAVDAGFAGGLVSAGLMVMPAPFGMLADRLKRRRPVMLIGCFLALLGFVILLVTTNALVAIGGALLVTASMAAMLPMQSVYATERFAAIGAGTVIGIVNTGGQIAQALSGPAYGMVLDLNWGWATVWSCSLVFCVLRLLAVLMLTEPPRETKAA